MNTQTLENTETFDTKTLALAKHLSIDPSEVFNPWNSDVYEADGCEYRVLTDDEADQAMADYIRETVWAFNADFLAGETGIEAAVFAALQKSKCLDANKAILSIISSTCGFDSFAESAAAADGRGHFLATYDNEEIELGTDLYAYRVG